ncbi:MAG: pilus assembly FimT family protein [Gemmatimonadota bacterium]
MHSGARAGFTLLELLIVLSIAGVLLTITLPRFGQMQARQQIANARDAYVWLAARARSLAVERGTKVYLEIDPALDRAWIRAGTDTLENLHYTNEYSADVTTGTEARVVVCYSPRGYALETCSAGLGTAVTFTGGPERARAQVGLIGMVTRQ